MRLALLASTVLFVAGLVATQSAQALTLEWTRNTEADMKEYRVWICNIPGCVVFRTGNTVYATIPQTAVGVNPSVVLPANAEGSVAVDAGDQTGNRSGLSARLNYSTIIDILAPGTPTGLFTRP